MWNVSLFINAFIQYIIDNIFEKSAGLGSFY